MTSFWAYIPLNVMKKSKYYWPMSTRIVHKVTLTYMIYNNATSKTNSKTIYTLKWWRLLNIRVNCFSFFLAKLVLETKYFTTKIKTSLFIFAKENCLFSFHKRKMLEKWPKVIIHVILATFGTIWPTSKPLTPTINYI